MRAAEAKAFTMRSHGIWQEHILLLPADRKTGFGRRSDCSVWSTHPPLHAGGRPNPKANNHNQKPQQFPTALNHQQQQLPCTLSPALT